MSYDDATRRLARLLQARAGEVMTSTAASVRQEAQRGVDAAIATAEPALGNPAADGYVLSSSTAGVRAWVPQAAAADWADITGKPTSFPPEAHAATHAAAGSDPVTITTVQVSDFAPAVNTAVDALLQAGGNVSLSYDAVLGTLTISVSGVPALSNATPQPLGTAAAGVGTSASRDDHAHAMPTAADVGAVPVTGGTFSGDIALNSDNGTLMARLVDRYNLPLDHFTAAPAAPWAWAGAPFVGTPSVVDTTTYPSHLAITHSLGGGRVFLFQPATTPDINVCAWMGINAYGGLRMDDGTDDNYVEYRVISAGATVSIERHVRTGSGTPVVTSLASNVPNQMNVYRLNRPASLAAAWISIGIGPRTSLIGTVSTGWTPTRAGIIYTLTSGSASLTSALIIDWVTL